MTFTDPTPATADDTPEAANARDRQRYLETGQRVEQLTEEWKRELQTIEAATARRAQLYKEITDTRQVHVRWGRNLWRGQKAQLDAIIRNGTQ